MGALDQGFYVGFIAFTGTTSSWAAGRFQAIENQGWVFAESGLVAGTLMATRSSTKWPLPGFPNREARFLSSPEEENGLMTKRAVVTEQAGIANQLTTAIKNTWVKQDKAAFLTLFADDAHVFVSSAEGRPSGQGSYQFTFSDESYQSQTGIATFWDKVFAANPV